MNNQKNMATLDIYAEPKGNFIPCNLYNKSLNKKVYLDPTQIAQKDHIYLYRVYNARCDFLPTGSYVSVKEVQSHPVSNKIIHIDLYAIEPTEEEIRLNLPIMYTGKKASVDMKRGAYPSYFLPWIEVKTTHKCLCPYLEVDVSKLKADTSLRSDQIVPPEGIAVIRSDLNVMTLAGAKGE